MKPIVPITFLGAFLILFPPAMPALEDGNAAAPASGEAATPGTQDSSPSTVEATPAAPAAPVAIRKGSRRSKQDLVLVMQDIHIAAGEKVGDVVAVGGNVQIDGEVDGDAVALMGNLIANGRIDGDAVTVLGDARIDVPVDGDVVVFAGDLVLGPNAVVKDAIVLGGALNRDPAALIRGDVINVPCGRIFAHADGLNAWMRSALFKGRPLSLAASAGWAWIVAAVFLGFYASMALLFPRGVEKCAGTLERRPGFTVLTAVLSVMALPLVFLLLAITGIGILLVPILIMALFLGGLFGRAAMLAWIGRRFRPVLGEGLFGHTAVAVILGGILVSLLYLVPVFGLLLWKLIGVLGLGVVVYTIILSLRGNGAGPVPAAVAAGGGAGPASVAAPANPFTAPVAPAGESGAPTPGASGPSAMAPVSQPAPRPPQWDVSAATLPRAGFWIRFWALMIDMIVIGVVIVAMRGFLPGPFKIVFGPPFLCALAAYGAVLWKLRGTTIGGSVCGLKLVRLDDRPLDWTTTVVRALGCFLSLIVGGLGFVWAAFDAEKQSWHDKIAGTTVVKAPKGVSLI